MKIFATDKADNAANRMRLELSGKDIELLEEVGDRLRRLVVIEDVLDVKGFISPYISGNDLPTLTSAGADFIEALTKGWDAETDIEYEANI